LPGGTYPLESGLIWFPAVGLLLGGLLALADLGLRWVQVGSLLESAAIVVLLLGLSGALHADGLMDTCDAVFSHASPERRLEIMRDPRSGAFGVVGLVCVVLLKVAALDSLPSGVRPALVWLAPGLGRFAIVLVVTVFPYGRASGMGAPLKSIATPRKLALAAALPAVACAIVGPIGLLGGVVAVIGALSLGLWLMRLLPGLTGDCYGAVCEVTETLVWLAGALVLPRLAV